MTGRLLTKAIFSVVVIQTLGPWERTTSNFKKEELSPKDMKQASPWLH